MSELAAAMASCAGASAEREQKMIEAITETHESTGEGSFSSQTLCAQEVQKIVETQEKTAREPGEIELRKLIKGAEIVSPSSWQEERQNWLGFRHRLRTWLSVVDPKVLQALDVVDKEPTKKLSMCDCAEEGKALSDRLYGILSSHTKNRPQRVLQAITQDNGLEGYGRLLEFNASATKARSLKLQRQIMNYRFSKEAGYSENILRFEELLKEFERPSKEKVSESLKMGPL